MGLLMMWDYSEEVGGGMVSTECEEGEGTNCEDGESDTDW